jgi:hypothetical protein
MISIYASKDVNTYVVYEHGYFGRSDERRTSSREQADVWFTVAKSKEMNTLAHMIVFELGGKSRLIYTWQRG